MKPDGVGQNPKKIYVPPTKGMMVTEGHLGGYVSGGDDATFYPDLWNWLVRDFGIRSVIDVGCGDGVAVRHFEGLIAPLTIHRRPSVIGIDGCQQESSNIHQWDYTTGPLGYRIEFDLCWSCEFVEHVEERYVPNFLATFACAKHVLMTHAVPGQAGHHHVNLRPPDYWIGVMAAIGYSFDRALTSSARGLAGLNMSPWNHFVRSGLAFTRN